MRFARRFAALLAVALAALSLGAASAFAAATVIVDGASSDVFNGPDSNGPSSATLTGATTFGTITCTSPSFTTDERAGGTAGDGRGVINFSFARCSANLGAGTCTVQSMSGSFEIDGAGAHNQATVDTYTIDTTINSTVVCDAVVNCTATVTTTTAGTNAAGTIDDAATHLTLDGTTRATAGTTHCTGNLTFTITIREDISIAAP